MKKIEAGAIGSRSLYPVPSGILFIVLILSKNSKSPAISKIPSPTPRHFQHFSDTPQNPALFPLFAAPFLFSSSNPASSFSSQFAHDQVKRSEIFHIISDNVTGGTFISNHFHKPREIFHEKKGEGGGPFLPNRDSSIVHHPSSITGA
jgi:hypothetical protein